MARRSRKSTGLRVVPTTTERAPAKIEAEYQEQVISELRLMDQFGRIGGALTPLVVTQIIQEADNGRPARLVDLLHEARQKSGHLHGVMSAFELQVQELAFQIAPPPNPTDDEIQLAQDCADAFSAANPTDMIGHLVGEGTWFGFAHVETIWKLDGGLILPERFNPIACRRFAFRQSDGALMFDPSGRGHADGPDAVDLLSEHPPGKFIGHAPRVNGDVRVREGLARCLVWAAMFGNWTVRDWMQLAEMAWKPKGFGKYKQGATSADRQALRLILQRALASGYAVYNGDTSEVELIWPQSSGSSGKMSPHKELVTFFGDDISKAVLGNPTVIQPGENGARSSDEVRERMTLRIREATARAVAVTIQRHFVEPYYAMNHGSARVGQFAFITDDAVDLEPFARAVKALREAGMRIPESWVADQTGIPAPDGDEELLSDGGKAATGGKPNEGQTDDGTEGETTEGAS